MKLARSTDQGFVLVRELMDELHERIMPTRALDEFSPNRKLSEPPPVISASSGQVVVAGAEAFANIKDASCWVRRKVINRELLPTAGEVHFFCPVNSLTTLPVSSRNCSIDFPFD
jgi:hypothetical protein